MQNAIDYPYRARVIENFWIPMPDGCRLAARLWLPETADPVPAIFETIPYRKRDFYRASDQTKHPYFAGHGYACVRVDLRGSGDSDGLLHDEYLKQEHDDAVACIAWIAAQPWCSGRVGMMGISWGGFNALQVAARRPPALAAIITVDSTDDRYADDVHYMGGCPLIDNLTWGTAFTAYQTRPPDPEVRGEDWRRTWMQRLEALPLLPAVWLSHQRRDAYWKHGSVCEAYADISCAVYAIGGWADGYSNVVPRLLAGLSCPRKGLIGPWGHRYPNDGVPGPAIGFLQDATRWWDHWLKDSDTGVMDEPMLRVWMQEPVVPKPFYAERPGRWVAETQWPSPRIALRTWYLTSHGLAEAPGSETALDHRSPLTTGVGGGEWHAFGFGPEFPDDQREDDGRSLCFDTAPLRERLEILGAPVVTLDAAVDRPSAFVAVRLNDVAPDGSSLMVGYGLLNLAHRDGHEHPTAIEPGRRLRLRVQVSDCAHAFLPGHRIRLALSTNYWPLVLPSPEPVTLRVFAGDAALALPVRPPFQDDDRLAPFPPAMSPSPLPRTVWRTMARTKRLSRDMGTGRTEIEVTKDLGHYRLDEIDLEISGKAEERFSIKGDDPLSARAEVDYGIVMARGQWRIETRLGTQLTATAKTFVVTALLEVFEGSIRIFTRTWSEEIARDTISGHSSRREWGHTTEEPPANVIPRTADAANAKESQ